jgi:peptide chain release factor 3
MGRDFLGCYDLIHDRLELMDRADRNKVAESVKIEGLDDPKLAEHIPEGQLAQLREEVEMARELLPPLDRTAFHQGTLTPIWFGSAINSFGVKELMDGIAEYGPEPQVQNAEPREVAPEEKKVAGFVFKVQANMDPKHRDRVAFVRMVSGHFQRGMKLTHVRSKKPMAISNPVLFLASDRELAEEAWAGDIIGIPNHGQLRIGDALTEGEALRFTGIPSFAPELLQTCRAGDPMKAKHLDKALMQFAEEGAAKVFKPTIGSGFIVGVVGALQFEVLASRIELEYGLPVRFEPSQFTSARWVSGPKDKVGGNSPTCQQAALSEVTRDNDGDQMVSYLTRLQWDIDRVERDYPDVTLAARRRTVASVIFVDGRESAERSGEDRNRDRNGKTRTAQNQCGQAGVICECKQLGHARNIAMAGVFLKCRAPSKTASFLLVKSSPTPPAAPSPATGASFTARTARSAPRGGATSTGLSAR